MNVKISKLTEIIDHYEIKGSPDVEVSGLSYNSKNVQKQNLFVCLEGLDTDGHLFSNDAAGHGAVAFLVNRWIEDLSDKVTQIKVKDTRLAMGLISAQFYGWPSNKLKLVGVTGTNGKSTTAEFIRSIATAANEPTGLIGTLGVFIKNKRHESPNTTPESAEIQKIFFEMVNKGVKLCVMEVSSHAIDQYRFVGCKFDALIFTNLSQDHLDYHKDMDRYFSVKLSLFQSKASKKENVFNVINNDDEWGREILKENSVVGKKFSYGLKDHDNKPDFMGQIVNSGLAGTSASYYLNTKDKVEVNVNLIGKFNVSNALAAASVCTLLNYENEHVKEGIESLKKIPGRCEIINTGSFFVIIDYAHTPDGLKNLLINLKKNAGKIILVFGCGGDRDRKKRPIMGKIADELSDFTVITSDNPRSEDPKDIIKEIVAGIKNKNNIEIIADRKKAIFYAVGIAEKGDLVVIAGKGHERYQEIKGERHHFSDREVAEEALNQ
jgi:UDP-N-acetylmuramoyl-L-alanyl-D-glutamate--2,6-diaminopimelate ligase